jgi:hypothetical protein
VIYFAQATIDVRPFPWCDGVEIGDVRIGTCQDVKRSLALLKAHGPVLLGTCKGDAKYLVRLASGYEKAWTAHWYLPHPRLLAFTRHPDLATCASPRRLQNRCFNVTDEEMRAYHELLRRRHEAMQRARDERTEADLRKLAETNPMWANRLRREYVEDPAWRRWMEDLISTFRRPFAPEGVRLLGLTLPFTRDDVKAAYRRRAKETLPDAGGDAARFVELERAYRDALAYARNT